MTTSVLTFKSIELAKQAANKRLENFRRVTGVINKGGQFVLASSTLSKRKLSKKK
jgi:hypothetical protein